VEHEGLPVVDPWKTCVFNISLATILIPFLLCSGFWKNYSDVRRVSPPSIVDIYHSTRSSIIREIDRMRKAGLALMAYFFFDFRDTQKQHRRDLISSLLLQLGARSDACHHIFSRFYLDHDEGIQQPSDDALSKCLTEMLQVPGQPATYIIIDALDESPNISGMPTAREDVLQFLEDLVDLQLPNVHICVSSRPEIDIRSILEPLALFRVSLHEESGQMADISGYIESVVHSDRNMRRWTTQNKQLVINTLSEKADGM